MEYVLFRAGFGWRCCLNRSFMGFRRSGLVGVCPNRDIRRQNLVCPRRNAENTFFDLWSPQEGAHKGRPYGGMRRGCIWHILNGIRQMSTKPSCDLRGHAVGAVGGDGADHGR